MKVSRVSKKTTRVGLISLGCAKNLVDAEIMLGSLLKAGMEITNDASEADAIIINTCSFIDAAQEESVDTILESTEFRTAGHRNQAVIVSGCLPQRFRDELPKLLPGVDAFMGIDQVSRVSSIVEQALVRRSERTQHPGKSARSKSKVVNRLAELERVQRRTPQPSEHPTPEHHEEVGRHSPLVDVNHRPTYIPDFATPRFRLTARHTAYVKIAEGCNHPCSFCIIPRMRGSHRSRPQKDIVCEARQLIAEGVRELNLISQDSTYYGLDLRPNRRGAIASPDKFSAATKELPVDATTLCTLLRELNAQTGDFWIRLLYTHPAHWTDELIRTIAECPKVARYVDMPLQHIHDNMLERMRRETSRQHIVDLIRKIRAGIPGIAIRTTFIVGFPGETGEYFEDLLGFIRETRFERLGVFMYSQEEGTRAGNMKGQISETVKRRRQKRAMAEQRKVSQDLSRSFVGRNIRVLVEKESDTRDSRDAEIDSWEHGLIRSGHGGQEGVEGWSVVARGEADAPDIDGRVYVRGRLPVGEFAQVRVVGHTDYDLAALPV